MTSTRSFLAVAALLFPLAACTTVTYVATPPPGVAVGFESDDPLMATRVSGARDLGCPSESLNVYRIEQATTSGGRARTTVRTYLDVAEGCGRRATYAERCGEQLDLPPGTSIAEAEHRAAWNVDGSNERFACQLTLIGRVALAR